MPARYIVGLAKENACDFAAALHCLLDCAAEPAQRFPLHAYTDRISGRGIPAIAWPRFSPRHCIV